MIWFNNQEVSRWIEEDVPYFDLTSHMLGISGQKGTMKYFTREPAVVSGTEEVKLIFGNLDIELLDMVPTGTRVHAGQVLISGRGESAALHKAWKVGQNILDHCSAIATNTAAIVEAVHEQNPNVAILTTRKSFPGTKKMAIKAVLAGGGIPHRLGTSETVLIFKQHLEFIGGLEGLRSKMEDIKGACCEKKILAEASCLEEAEILCEMGVDGIQFDKLRPEDIKYIASRLKEKYPAVTILAAGGINRSNAAEYANCGIDGIVTTSPYAAAPIDVGVTMEMEQQKYVDIYGKKD